MKLFMKILVCVFALSVLFSMLPFQSICSQLEKDVLRLHILANSDTDFDQNIKLQVRDKVIEKVSYLYDNARTKEDAKRITNENLAYIEQTANEELKQNNIPYKAKAEVKNIYFNTRYYDNFTMPAGYYDALEITLGKGQGHNWWCVMYPSLCVGTATDSKMKEDLSKNEYNVVTAKDFTFRFKVVEYYEKLRSYLK
ncbi:MAG: stage II sporulation protein R [Oscillospiraceae bacterium]|nr:stage II sporulation protein R [Candidatus Ruminococcus equi]